MTREEAIAQLKMDRDLCNFNPMTGEEEPMNEDCRKSADALDIAIKAIEQQPCEDAVSRGEVNMLCARYLKTATDDHVAFYEHFCDLPSVTPTRKASEWQQDHAILKAHADGANEVIDRIKDTRAAINNMGGDIETIADCLQIIDQLIAEVEG